MIMKKKKSLRNRRKKKRKSKKLKTSTNKINPKKRKKKIEHEEEKAIFNEPLKERAICTRLNEVFSPHTLELNKHGPFFTKTN